MTAFLENPIPIIFLGIIVEGMLATIFASTRQSWALWAMVGVLVVVFAGVGLEMLVVTDVERVEATLDGAVEALEANDLNRLLDGYIAPEAIQARGLATAALRRVDVTSAKISNLNIEVNRLTSPPTAQAQFLGSVHYEPHDFERVPYRHYSARLDVRFRLEDDRWIIMAVERREL